MVAVDYSATNPRIFVSDFLHKTEDGTFRTGIDQFNPTIISIANEKQLLSQAITTVQTQSQEMKKQNTNPQAYQEKMSKEVYANLLKMYEGQLGEKELAQSEMSSTVDKNITTQETFAMFQEILKPDTELPTSFSSDTQPEVLDFMKRFDLFIEHSSSAERTIRKESIQKLVVTIENIKKGKLTENRREAFQDPELTPQLIANTKQLFKGGSPLGVASRYVELTASLLTCRLSFPRISILYSFFIIFYCSMFCKAGALLLTRRSVDATPSEGTQTAATVATAAPDKA